MKHLKFFFLLTAAVVLASCGGNNQGNSGNASSGADTTASVPAANARVFFKNVNSGDTVTSPVHLEFGVEGMTVHPAGEVIAGTGHHHLIIDGSFVPKGQVVPSDSTHIHYGKGQTQADIPLSPGAHTLTLQFADGMHQSYGKDMSATVSVYVKGGDNSAMK